MSSSFIIRRRKHLTLQQKYEIIQAVKNSKKKKIEIAAHYGINPSSLSTILKDEATVLRRYSRLGTNHTKRVFRDYAYSEEVFQGVHNWYFPIYRGEDSEFNAAEITKDMLKKKAAEIAQQLGENDFVATSAFIRRFETCFDIKLAGSADDSDNNSAEANTSTGYDEEQLMLTENHSYNDMCIKNEPSLTPSFISILNGNKSSKVGKLLDQCMENDYIINASLKDAASTSHYVAPTAQSDHFSSRDLLLSLTRHLSTFAMLSPQLLAADNVSDFVLDQVTKQLCEKFISSNTTSSLDEQQHNTNETQAMADSSKSRTSNDTSVDAASNSEESGALLRPFKIWDITRTVRKGVAAHSLNHLISKVQQLFACKNSAITLVLEEDGTSVDDDAYLRLLPDQTKFIALIGGNQTWRPNTGTYDEASRHSNVANFSVKSDNYAGF